ELPAVEGAGEPCPKCREGKLVARRGRYGPFAGCSRYPDCDYIHRTGPPPPPPLPFKAECPKCGKGQLTPRRARRSGDVFWGCSRYPKCDLTTNMEPLGALHDVDSGPVALKDERGICLKCGASIELPADRDTLPGQKLVGGPADPDALKPQRKARSGGTKRAKRASTRKKTRETTKSAAAPDADAASLDASAPAAEEISDAAAAQSESSGSGDPPSVPAA
ncbi:MAG: type I DNA topoisomerase, partial [Chloroflexota bacterium]